MHEMSTPSNRRILVIDDNEAIHADFQKILAGSASSSALSDSHAAFFGQTLDNANNLTFEIDSALQGQEGLEKVSQSIQDNQPYALAFVDIRMPPGWDGIETIGRIWKVDPDLLIVICTAYNDYNWNEMARKLGNMDQWLILRKPFDNVEVSQLAASLTEKWDLARKADLKLSEMQRIAETTNTRLKEMAYSDALTRLPNRASILNSIQHSIDHVDDNNFALLFLDFDRFKQVNDSLGHDVGDDLLKQIASRLRKTLRVTDKIVSARLGGDEFVVLLSECSGEAEAIAVAERLLKVLSQCYILGAHTIYSTASIGIVTSEYGYESSLQILRDADLAMYEAKAAGKGCYAVFDQAVREREQARHRTEGELRKAVSRDEFVVAYQPIVSLETGELEGFEALVRWMHPRRGLVSPDEFVPIAEESGLIVTIGIWVLDEACRQLALWRQVLGDDAPRCIHVNISRRQLVLPNLVKVVKKTLKSHGVTPESLHLEVTENNLMQDSTGIISALTELRQFGVKIDMDDFGTGYSSLSCLHEFPIDVLKIDRSFIANVQRVSNYAALLQSMLTLAENLGMQVVTEGIENAEQLAILQAMGCEFGQGYFFAKPMFADEAEEYIAKRVKLTPIDSAKSQIAIPTCTLVDDPNQIF